MWLVGQLPIFLDFFGFKSQPFAFRSSAMEDKQKGLAWLSSFALRPVAASPLPSWR
jgi:hypothetical protein